MADGVVVARNGCDVWVCVGEGYGCGFGVAVSVAVAVTIGRCAHPSMLECAFLQP